jgi:hypothetical protein
MDSVEVGADRLRDRDALFCKKIPTNINNYANLMKEFAAVLTNGNYLLL